MARLQPGCEQLKAILIARKEPLDGGPNWEVLAFHPELSPTARVRAIAAIEIVRGRYALAPYITPARGKASKN